MDKKTYRIAPYEKEYWHWLIYAMMVTFLVWLFSDFFWFDMPNWSYAVIFLLACVGFGLSRIHHRDVEMLLSEDGIQINNRGRETLRLTPWSSFDSGYILKLFSYSKRYDDCDTYFLLTEKPLNEEMLEQISFDLRTTKPCGIWKEYIVVKTGKADNKTIQNAIGDRLEIKEYVYCEPD